MTPTDKMTNDETLLIRFRDGPFQGVGNVPTLAGTKDVEVKRSEYGWPLPERLVGYLPAGGEDLWLADALKFPKDVTSIDCEVYRKVSESQISEEDIKGMDIIVRGAGYEHESTRRKD